MNLKNYKQLSDLKTLSSENLKTLSSDIRESIYNEVQKNGGHLGSNLAVVDLTISLLSYFGDDAYYLFDTGYQAYAYKLLTTRPNVLENMHKINGYSVFQEIKEGDLYSGGHTSISTAWASGYKKFLKNIIIEIIGDGSLATSVGLGGMLNFASDNFSKGLFILNDNKQGIGINKFNYLDWQKIATGMDFVYYEVEDGHDFCELKKAWDFFSKSSKNVFIKVNTTKAYGISVPNPDQAWHYHSISSSENNVFSATKLMKEELDIIFKNNSDAVLFNAGMMYSYGLIDLQKKYPTQIFDTGISEEIAIIEAAAAANLNKQVYVMINSSFFQRTYDQLVHDIFRNKSNITIFITSVGINLIGDSHHGIYDLNMYNIFEEIKIYHPSTTGELKSIIKKLDKYKGVKIIRLEDDLITDYAEKNIEKWQYEINESANKVLITYGKSFDLLKTYITKNKINIGLINAVSLTPLDKDLLKNLFEQKKEIYTYELVMQKNNLAANMRTLFKDYKIIDFSFKKTTIGRADEQYILKQNDLDFETIFKNIL